MLVGTAKADLNYSNFSRELPISDCPFVGRRRLVLMLVSVVLVELLEIFTG
jgi:hypothetical protein